jgi:hypothetical protein
MQRIIRHSSITLLEEGAPPRCLTPCDLGTSFESNTVHDHTQPRHASSFQQPRYMRTTQHMSKRQQPTYLQHSSTNFSLTLLLSRTLHEYSQRYCSHPAQGHLCSNVATNKPPRELISSIRKEATIRSLPGRRILLTQCPQKSLPLEPLYQHLTAQKAQLWAGAGLHCSP